MTRAMRPDLVKRIPLVAALATLIVHLIGNPHYGFFRDELYFIICGFHPAWGYVDQPPVVPLLAAATQFFGHSLFAVRALCACFAAASVYTTCLLVIELGGGAFAEGFAALVAALHTRIDGFRNETLNRYRRDLALAAGGAVRFAHRQGSRSALVARSRCDLRHRDREQVLRYPVRGGHRRRAAAALRNGARSSRPGSRPACCSRPPSHCRTSCGKQRTDFRCGRYCAKPANIETSR